MLESYVFNSVWVIEEGLNRLKWLDHLYTVCGAGKRRLAPGRVCEHCKVSRA